jgi:peptidoglycan/xylan/chitin deacetylase (PgdA/CDA1 family)/uncharacterized caspase-like protein
MLLIVKKIVIAVILTLVCAHPLWASDFQSIVNQHRKMLILLEGTQDTDPASDPIFAARNFYVQKYELIEKITSQAEHESTRETKDRLLPVSQAFIDFTTNTQKLHDGDLLAFLDLIDELLVIEETRGISFQGIQPLKMLNISIDAILNVYRDEYSKSLQKLGNRGAKQRESWSEYIEFIKSIYKYEALLIQVLQTDSVLFREITRGTTTLTKKKKDQLKSSKPKLIWGNSLPRKTVVLTFDDGPHYSRTGKILDILKEYRVKGYFFSLGKNLGSINKKGKAKLNSKRKSVVRRIIQEGHVIANHSYSHPVLTKLKDKKRLEELANTNSLLKVVTGSPNALFRPPYGSKDKDLEKLASEQGMIVIMWNVDSLDWADPVPESIADRVLRTLEQQEKGILLFHDIHRQTVKALPDILKGLKEHGYRVVTMDGTPFSKNESGIPYIKTPTDTEKKLYNNSWAVVIGINNYQHWPKLKYAVNDAQSIAKILHTKLGFPKKNIFELYDEDATRERIVEVLGYNLADPKKVTQEDRVFIFYAGHGMTRPLASGKKLGYIIPVDTELIKFQNKGISMSQFDDYSALIHAKHVYFVMDSCYSGLALTRSGVSIGQTINYLKQITSRRSRQILTAGGADQQVADGGPEAHSIFTWTLLQALEGLADTDNNGYVTASEIGTYVSPVVASYADQTPAFGNMVGSQGGDFVFKITKNAVDAINKKLAEETRKIEAELEALKNNTQAIVKRRLELQLALEQAKKDIKVDKTANIKITPKNKNNRIKQARRLNASALQYFKEKKYELAKDEWQEAVRLNPYNPTIVNNYGYILDKLNKNKEALKWYYRTVELEPKRTAVYRNLGNIMIKLNRHTEAIPYYERYLHLYPSSKDAKQLRKIIKDLKLGLLTAPLID